MKDKINEELVAALQGDFLDVPETDVPDLSAEKVALLNSLQLSEEDRNQPGRLSLSTARPVANPELVEMEREEVPPLIDEPIAADPIAAEPEKEEPAGGYSVDNAMAIADEFNLLNVEEKIVKAQTEPPPIPSTDKVFADALDEGSESVQSVNRSPESSTAPLVDVESLGKILREESIVGLNIWDTKISACLLTYKGGKLEVSHAGDIELPADSTDQDRARLIRVMWKRTKMPVRSVWASFHSESLLQKYVKYDLTGEELEQALMHDADQSIVSGGNSVVQWAIHRNATGGSEGMLYALPKWERDHQIAMLKKAGLYVCGLGVPACDIGRLLKFTRPYIGLARRPVECVVNFSRNGADIVMISAAGSIYSRTVFSRKPSWEENTSYLYECLNDAISYFTGWIDGGSVSAILLTGLVPEIQDISGEILREIGVFAEKWSPVKECKVLSLGAQAKQSGLSSVSYAVAIGTALMRA